MCYYFSHDCDAHRNKKLLKLRGVHGWRGYGLYWGLLEKLREDKDHRLPTDYRALRAALDAPPRLIRSVVEDFNLFVIDEEQEEFYSPGLLERMELVYNNKAKANSTESAQDVERRAEISRKRSEAGAKGGKIGGKAYHPSKANAKQKESKPDTEESKTKANGGTIGGQAPQKDKRAKDKKEDTPQAPQGAGESLDSGLESSSLGAGTATATPQPPSTLLDEERPEWLTDDLLERYYRHKDDYDEPDPQMKRVDEYMVQRMLRETEELTQRQEAQEIEREYERAKISPATVDEVCALYERYCQGLIPLTPYDRHRISEIAQLLRSQTLAGIERIFRKAGRSPFLRGEVNGWRASLGWLIKAENYHKVLAGNYDKRKIQDQGTPSPSVGIPIETSDEKRQKLLERMERNVIRTPQTEEQ